MLLRTRKNRANWKYMAIEIVDDEIRRESLSQAS